MLLVVGEALVIGSRGADGSLLRHASGAPAIAAWVAASLGTPTVFCAAVGDDADGRLLVDALTSAGGDPGGVAVKPTLPTAAATVEYRPDGLRTFEFAVAGSAATALETADLGDFPERCTWIHISGSAVLFGDQLAATVVVAVDRARAAGATVSVDPNLRAELTDATALATLRSLCLAADVLFPSVGELDGLDLEEDSLVESGTVVCTTLAEHGARLRTREQTLTVPALAISVVDPDGAGDTFAGAVIAARLAGADWAQASRVASEVVAKAVAVRGPMTADLTPGDLN